MQRAPEQPANFAGSMRSSVMPSSWKMPFCTSLKATICAPSSLMLLLKGGIEPGTLPPTSAWWPRDAVKKLGLASPLFAKTGVMTVMSGRCEPPAISGWLETRTSPSASPPCSAQYLTWNLTASCMEPRWTGRCGAFATRPPCASKTAQEKSSRSLMLTEIEVRCRRRPICSAMPMKRWANRLSQIGSSSVVAFSPPPAGTSMTRLPSAVTFATQPGSTTTVATSCITMAGPSTRWPGFRSPARKTPEARQPPSK
mmetsp:Transcript_96225/g.207640  ORF Transcript_96225/g.207640 Transcript_96225/m.207640 type:complete len:255 (+) Transcript_96225:992-1756(+)